MGTFEECYKFEITNFGISLDVSVKMEQQDTFFPSRSSLIMKLEPFLDFMLENKLWTMCYGEKNAMNFVTIIIKERK